MRRRTGAGSWRSPRPLEVHLIGRHGNRVVGVALRHRPKVLCFGCCRGESVHHIARLTHGFPPFLWCDRHPRSWHGSCRLDSMRCRVAGQTRTRHGRSTVAAASSRCAGVRLMRSRTASDDRRNEDLRPEQCCSATSWDHYFVIGIRRHLLAVTEELLNSEPALSTSVDQCCEMTRVPTGYGATCSSRWR
jgi:hypothetical protein